METISREPSIHARISSWQVKVKTAQGEIEALGTITGYDPKNGKWIVKFDHGPRMLLHKGGFRVVG